ncbi:MAG TPA: D-alanyl-D-alanine carboxypeptidase/D-alanyl-D-alanine-endopeptidase [Pyrinomonadaceae bacterium]|nr:D-alanyl-D-alanine carboxypeptidase/D-alanyl-D-alanine-endopeptidase [Pyrinomonadaceae bacterium]
MNKKQLVFPRYFISALMAVFVATGANGQVTKPAPTSTPTPVVTPTPIPTPLPVETLADLQAKIRSRVMSAELRRGRVGIKIVSLNSGKVVFEQDAEKYFMPASNMKNFTVATAIEKLTPDFKFVTSVYALSQPDTNGLIKGDLRIFGRGDVSISTAFFGTTPTDPETYYKGIDRLADKIVAAGVKRIDGNLIADESYFLGNPVPGEWEWDDLQWYYGAEVSALPLNDNAVDISVAPGSKDFAPCVVSISPPNSVFQIINNCTTSWVPVGRSLTVNKKIDRNVLEISGTIPPNGKGFKGSISVTHPAELFIALLKQRLQKKGIVVTGGTRTKLSNSEASPLGLELTRLESPPFVEIAAKTMKPSQNLYTETILWTLGEVLHKGEGPEELSVNGTITRQESSQLGLRFVNQFLESIGIPSDGIIQHDGSGLSRHNLITPAAVVRLYTYMAKESKYSQAWRDALTIAGVDGTLKNRMVGTRAANNLRGKTGTIDQVSALSGYVTTAAGEQLVVSFIVNGVNTGRDRTSMMDDIVVNLANFSGRVD